MPKLKGTEMEGGEISQGGGDGGERKEEWFLVELTGEKTTHQKGKLKKRSTDMMMRWPLSFLGEKTIR